MPGLISAGDLLEKQGETLKGLSEAEGVVSHAAPGTVNFDPKELPALKQQLSDEMKKTQLLLTAPAGPRGQGEPMPPGEAPWEKPWYERIYEAGKRAGQTGFGLSTPAEAIGQVGNVPGVGTALGAIGSAFKPPLRLLEQAATAPERARQEAEAQGAGVGGQMLAQAPYAALGPFGMVAKGVKDLAMPIYEAGQAARAGGWPAAKQVLSKAWEQPVGETTRATIMGEYAEPVQQEGETTEAFKARQQKYAGEQQAAAGGWRPTVAAAAGVGMENVPPLLFGAGGKIGLPVMEDRALAAARRAVPEELAPMFAQKFVHGGEGIPALGTADNTISEAMARNKLPELMNPADSGQAVAVSRGIRYTPRDVQLVGEHIAKSMNLPPETGFNFAKALQEESFGGAKYVEGPTTQTRVVDVPMPERPFTLLKTAGEEAAAPEVSLSAEQIRDLGQKPIPGTSESSIGESNLRTLLGGKSRQRFPGELSEEIPFTEEELRALIRGPEADPLGLARRKLERENTRTTMAKQVPMRATPPRAQQVEGAQQAFIRPEPTPEELESGLSLGQLQRAANAPPSPPPTGLRFEPESAAGTAITPLRIEKSMSPEGWFGKELTRQGLTLSVPGLRQDFSTELFPRSMLPGFRQTAEQTAQQLIDIGRRGTRAEASGAFTPNEASQFPSLRPGASGMRGLIRKEFDLDGEGNPLPVASRWSMEDRTGAWNQMLSAEDLLRKESGTLPAPLRAAQMAIHAWKTMLLSSPPVAWGVGMLHLYSVATDTGLRLESLMNGIRGVRAANILRNPDWFNMKNAAQNAALPSIFDRMTPQEASASILDRPIQIGSLKTTLAEEEQLMARFGVTSGGMDPTSAAPPRTGFFGVEHPALGVARTAAANTLGIFHEAVNTLTETLRRAAWYDVRASGLGPSAAAEYALRPTFDYSAKTRLGNAVSGIFPFGNARRLALNFAVRRSLEQPGMANAMLQGPEALKQFSMRAAGVRPEDQTPEQQEQTGIFMPPGIMGPAATFERYRDPLEDIRTLTKVHSMARAGNLPEAMKFLADQVISAGGPAKAIVEGLVGKTFRGYDLSGQGQVGPATAGFIDALSKASLASAPVPRIDLAKGEKTPHTEASRAAAYVLDALIPTLASFDAIYEPPSIRRTEQETSEKGATAAGLRGPFRSSVVDPLEARKRMFTEDIMPRAQKYLDFAKDVNKGRVPMRMGP